MKKDVTTSIVIALVGVVIGFLVTQFFMKSNFSGKVKYIANVPSDVLAQPDENIFNFNALNPTVETFVGSDDSCTAYDEFGNCVAQSESNVIYDETESVAEDTSNETTNVNNNTNDASNDEGNNDGDDDDDDDDDSGVIVEEQ